MNVDLVIEDDRWKAVALDSLAQRAGQAVSAHFGIGREAEVGLLACDDARIATLNTDFRGQAQPTNVLSWPSQDRAAPPGQHPSRPTGPELGDIAISYDTCAREAAEQGKAFTDHVTHLLVHAMLHLLGYDHMNEKDAALMEGSEVEILGKLGISDPYEA